MENLKKSETNDCVPTAISNAFGIDYDRAHSFAKTKLGRKDRKGTFDTSNKIRKMLSTQKTILKKTVQEVEERKRTNLYKVNGEVIRREMRLPSFIRANPKGTFLVTVAKHMLAVIDGKIVDDGFCAVSHPNCRVKAAFKIGG